MGLRLWPLVPILSESKRQSPMQFKSIVEHILFDFISVVFRRQYIKMRQTGIDRKETRLRRRLET